MTTSSQEPTPPSRAHRAWLFNLILLGITCALCIGVLEAVGQWRRPALPTRALFFSENPWQYDARGFLAFQPSRALRTVAAYGEELEYDVTFRTNALGFIDDREYDASGGSERRIAVVGDSFTAGYHGGKAWVPTLRLAPGFDARHHSLFNFGVSGTGMPNFRGLLATFVPALGVDEILIVAIANDFERPLIRAVATESGVALCNVDWPEERCAAQTSQIFTIALDASEAAVLGAARETWAAKNESLLARIRHKSFLLQTVRQLMSRRANPTEPDFGDLGAIRAAHAEARLRLLQLPEKAEVLNDNFVSLQRQVESAGAEYHDGNELCGLHDADFLPNDSHPNESGYTKVRDCVLRILAL